MYKGLEMNSYISGPKVALKSDKNKPYCVNQTENDKYIIKNFRSMYSDRHLIKNFTIT